VLGREELALADQPVLAYLVAHRSPWPTTILQAATNLGASWFLVPFVALVGGMWWWRRRAWQPLALLGGAYLGALVLARLVKVLVGRPRPPAALMLDHATGAAFPSGHTTEGTAVFVLLAVLLAAGTVSWGRKLAAAAGAVLVVLVIGFSRLYLGVHWLTDVLAGYALGGLWLCALLLGVRGRLGRIISRPAPHPEPPRAG